MVNKSQLVEAKPAIARFIRQHFPNEIRYFEPFWTGVLVWLNSADHRKFKHLINFGVLGLVDDAVTPAQKSLETIEILANAIPAFGGSRPPEEVIRNYILEKAKKLRTEEHVLTALVGLIMGILDSEENADVRTRIDFLPQCVKIQNPRTSQTSRHGHSNPWKLMEYLCYQVHKETHWLCGFVVFPEWIKKTDSRACQQSFMEHRARLKDYLKELSVDHWPLAKIEHGAGPYTRLDDCRFESNVFEAQPICLEAKVLLYDGKYQEALNKAQEAITIWDGCDEAFTIVLACLAATGLEKIPEDFLRDILRRVKSRANVLRDALEYVGMDHSNEKAIQGAKNLLGSWRVELSQIIRAKKQLADRLKTEMDTPEEYTPAHAFIDKIESFRIAPDKDTKNCLWEEITESVIYKDAKVKCLAILGKRNQDLFQRNKDDVDSELDSLFCEHITTVGGMNSTTPRKLQEYTATIMANEILSHWTRIEKGLTSSDERALRELRAARRKLHLIQEIQPSVEDLGKMMDAPPQRVQLLLDMERLSNPVLYREDSSDAESA